MAAALDSARPVRWGILGAGQIASTVGADIAASPHSEIVAVGARDAGRAADFARRLGIPRSYGSYDDLVADPEIDVVYIATTHAQHHEHALLALRAGKPVLVEKAFTLTARQARDVVVEARSRDLFCMEAMWMRLNPLIQQAVEIAHSGRIGELTGVRGDLSKHFPFDPHAPPLRPGRRGRGAPRPRRLPAAPGVGRARPTRGGLGHWTVVTHGL